MDDAPASGNATAGIVLRLTPVRESDLVVQLFTHGHGRVSAIARGARRSRRRFAGCLEPMVVLAVELGRRGRGSELWTLEAADVRDDHRALAADPIVLGHASYGLELVRELAPPEVPEPALLRAVVTLWRALAAGPSPAVLRAFELAICHVLGSEVALETCAACGSPDLEHGAVFDPVRGGAVCARCAPRSTNLGVRPLPDAARRHLLAIAAAPAGDDFAAARAIDAEPDVRITARDAMLAFVGHLVGRPLQTLGFVTQVHASLRR